tara:strand:- start:52 stop:534 length:483 start_codon:yes stop_codon:yes gene_type:complete
MVNDPTFWVAIGFLILAVLALIYVRKPLFTALDKRAATIENTLNEAANLREEAQQLLAEYQRKQRDAVKETEDVLQKAKLEIDRLTVDAEKKLNASLKRREELALEKISQMEAEAIRSVRVKSVEISIAATRKLIADNIDKTQSEAIIDDAISDLSSKMH